MTGVEMTGKDNPIKNNHKSLEHIIPNALGGKISSYDVLSFGANQKLNETIDKEFNKIFSSFILKLDIEKDRKSSPSMKAVHTGYDTDVIFKDGRYFPRKPLYIEEKKTIYADSLKTAENYRFHLIKTGKLKDDEIVKLYDDIAGEMSLSFGFDNNIFKNGLAKIAAGYATLKGVSRNNLKSIINLDEELFQENIIALPAVPTTKEWMSLEENTYRSKHYPIHGIVLSGTKVEKKLFCYVELFSTFQYYILLDDNYDGDDIYESYIYDILHAQEINYVEYIKSVPEISNVEGIIFRYRKINFESFLKLRKVSFDKMKSYNHYRFHTLSAFSNYFFITKKIEKLGTNEENKL
ncbi:HNH endonuclease [Acinetobacter modestus]|uniref:HNH endonuclease n=1 Tax=Acinetobacter modestus TaxID=1776740 RepID=UPI001F4B9796|nr:HNH endonuclease [Acinetobacter modestus]MCH7386206.1 HNH endonuclease [Acinetobacter modestus]